MVASPIFEGPLLRVEEWCCTAGVGAPAVVEPHAGFSLSYVRRGTFGLWSSGRSFEMTVGSLVVGHRGGEYACTHEHACGDECLCFYFAPDLAESLAPAQQAWKIGALPPLAAVITAAELAQTAACGRGAISLEEAGLLLASRFARAATGAEARPTRAGARDRQRALGAAALIQEAAPGAMTLSDLARAVGLSPFHFLRLFSSVFGVTPHKYLVRCRLRHATRLLIDTDQSITEVAGASGFEDLSNFVRTFGRAAGVSPRAFRSLSRGDRKILQEALRTAL
jgi:AraC-like DNA-binding protein